jgi:hypothetical protein
MEWNGYLGVGLLVLLALTVWHWRRIPLVLWSGAMAAGVLVLSFGPHLHLFGSTLHVPLPWRVLGALPYFEHILPSRLMVHFYLFAGIVVAFLVDRIIASRGRLQVRAAGAVLVTASLLLLVPVFPMGATPAPTPPFFSGAASRIPQGSVAVVAPFARSSEIMPMVWQANAGFRFRMPEGYAIRPTPDGDATFDPDPSATDSVLTTIEEAGTAPPHDAATRRQMSCDLARWDARTVIIGPMPHQEQAEATYTWLLGRSPDRVQGVLVWWNVRGAC